MEQNEPCPYINSKAGPIGNTKIYYCGYKDGQACPNHAQIQWGGNEVILCETKGQITLEDLAKLD